jgi:uncharacterized membrane protein YfcA
MSVESTQAEVGFPLAGWAAWTGAPALGLGILAGAIALVRHEAGVIEAGALAFAVVLVGSIVGAMILAQSSARIPAAWGGVLLYAQGVRMFVSVSVGLGAFFLAHPEPFAFWLFFLAASMAVLAGEVAYVLKWIRTAEAHAGREER